MKVAVTGPKGLLGGFLVSHYKCIPIKSDITKYEKLKKEIAEINPTAIINCAAYTHVDKAQQKKEYAKAIKVNSTGPANIRLAFGGKLIHMSSAYVFNGLSHVPYVENDECSPIGNYSWSKWGGEIALEGMISYGQTLIARTMTLFGYQEHKQCFVQRLLGELESGKSVTLPSNLYSNPTYIPDLAKNLFLLLEHNTNGTIHLAGQEIVSRAKFGEIIADVFGFHQYQVVDFIYSKSTPRAQRVGMSTGRARSLGLQFRPIREALEDMKTKL